ncbi:cytochrome c oxidase assembly factor 4 homolog, mitochondrial-like [Uloborus diversus]|uniref:cytochrome c oxidase assembly factor 4 homolog, mitochondrial-like n=1 Tax=Uloborus diversus TaxID=327109 RepID=UPI0024095DF3|nr:cytochrome c oxidase assembly factor 4 homolog, mitochondrial-like [Uloborus diversus]
MDSSSAKTVGHGVIRANDDDTDVVDKLLNETGCSELHYKVQECIAETKDWRKCQKEVTEFRNCINRHEQRKVQDGKT